MIDYITNSMVLINMNKIIKMLSTISNKNVFIPNSSGSALTYRFKPSKDIGKRGSKWGRFTTLKLKCIKKKVFIVIYTTILES